MYLQPSYRLAFRILGNEEEAHDAVQESFVKVWQKIRTWDPSRGFTAWLNRILVNTAADHLRAIRRHPSVPVDPALPLPAGSFADPGTILEKKDLAALVRHLADGLPAKQKLVFILRDIEGMTSDEVEAVTKLPGTSVKSNLCLARKTIREKLLGIMETGRSVQ
jgi:RNA polymerase sigma-70 factor (ECF subfamily)